MNASILMRLLIRTVLPGLLVAFTGLSLGSAGTDNGAARPRVALVLSGGGALGYAHIGVLSVLDQLRVPVDCVVGTSMGAMVGGAFASGVSPAQMIETLDRTDVAALFDDEPPRADIAQRVKRDDYLPLFDFTLGLGEDGIALPVGVSAGYKFELFIKKLIGSGAAGNGLVFDRLPTPFRAVATDLETGEMKVFDHGALSSVMRASMSLPAIVAPTRIDDRIYIDGGLVRNLPIDIGRKLCGDFIIAINLGTKPLPKEQIRNSLDIALQSILILTEQNVRRSLAELSDLDVLVTPDLEGYSSSDFAAHAEIIRRGIAAALEQRGDLSRFSVSEAAYQAWLDERRDNTPVQLPVTRIAALPSGRITEDVILRDIKVKPGEDFDDLQLDRDLARTFGRGDFSYIGYSLVPDGEGNRVVIEADQRPWGPGYLKFGLGAATDADSPAQLNFAASYRRTWLNDLGAEWRTDMQLGYDSVISTEFMQPWQVRDGAFVSLVAGVRRRPLEIYQKDNRLGEIQVERLWAGLDVGVTGRLGELRFGPYVGHVHSEPNLGAINPILSSQSAFRSGLVLRGTLDQLDSVNFPRSGLLIGGEVKASIADWGSEDDFTQGILGVSVAKSFGENTVFARLEWGEQISGDDLPVVDSFQLGGPRRLSGLYLDQLTGDRYNLAAFSYYRRFATLPSQLGRGVYLGGSLEAGRINDFLMEDPWEWVTSGSVFWGADTLLGPAYLGYGYSSLGQSSVYLTIGPHF